MVDRFCFKLIVVCWFIVSSAGAQEIVWQNTVQALSSDQLNCISHFKNGDVIAGGSSTSNAGLEKSENSRGSWDYWIVRLDSIGEVKWEKTIGGNSDDYLTTVLETNDNGVLCGGYSDSDSSGDKNENCKNASYDYWIVKLDSLGNIQWQNTIGGDYQDYLTSMTLTKTGGYICAGRSNSRLDGDKLDSCKGGFDYWILELDTLGNIVWQKTIGGGLDDHLTSISSLSGDGYICGGSSRSHTSGDKIEMALGWDYWVLKLDLQGNILWQNTIGGNSVDNLASIEQTNDGGFICGGNSFSDISGEKSVPNKGLWGTDDFWIVKLDSLGGIQWQKSFGGINEDDLNAIHQTSDSGYICGGYTLSEFSGDQIQMNIQNKEFWILKLDKLGNIEWQNCLAGNSLDILSSIAISNDRAFICAGYSHSTVSDDKTEASIGRDYWILKITNHFSIIKGNVWADINANSVKDLSDAAMTNLKILDMTTNQFTFSNVNGDYSLIVMDTGTFNISPSNLNYYFPNPTDYLVTFSSLFQIDSLNDFYCQPVGSFDDLCMSVTPLGPFRPGFNGSYMLNCENVGTTTQNPTIVFHLYPNVSFVSASVPPSAVYPDSVVWNQVNFTPFQQTQILVTVNLSPSIPIGSILNSYAQIRPIDNDFNPSCNNATWEVTVTGSVDPNDILVDQDTLFSTVFPNPPFLEYLIRFQNTGTDTAFTVKILNPIDTFKLDLNSLEFVAASHPMDMRFIYHERNMEFLFNNILLPDSNVNEPASHGFVRYKIKPKSNLQVGDSIKNFAAIYFDFNEPVITNTAMTKIVTPTGINFVEKNTEIKLYPNPATNELFVEIVGPAGMSISIDLFNLYGQKTRSLYYDRIGNAIWKGKFDLTGLNAGMYLLQYNVDGVTKSVKFVKM